VAGDAHKQGRRRWRWTRRWARRRYRASWVARQVAHTVELYMHALVLVKSTHPTPAHPAHLEKRTPITLSTPATVVLHGQIRSRHGQELCLAAGGAGMVPSAWHALLPACAWEGAHLPGVVSSQEPASREETTQQCNAGLLDGRI